MTSRAANVRLRPASSADVPGLAALFAESVRALGPSRYSAEQVEAWAAFAQETERFSAFILDAWTLVAEDDSGLLGFAGLGADGHVTSLYVAPAAARRGVGSRLLTALLEEAGRRGLPLLYTEASEFSRPLFGRHGFTVEEVERVERGGVLFLRYRMVRRLVLPHRPLTSSRP